MCVASSEAWGGIFGIVGVLDLSIHVASSEAWGGIFGIVGVLDLSIHVASNEAWGGTVSELNSCVDSGEGVCKFSLCN